MIVDPDAMETMNDVNAATVRYIGAWERGTVSALTVVTGSDGNQVCLAGSGAGLFRSIDHGQTWQRSVTGMTDIAVIALASATENPDSPQRAWATTETGRLYSSQDSGLTWREITSWAGHGIASQIVASPVYAQDQTLFLATANGVMRSTDGAHTWESSTFGLLDLDILCLAAAPGPTYGGRLWAGTAGGGLYRSRNAAKAWRESGAGLPDTAIQCIALSPCFEQDATIWAGLEDYGLFFSTDGGHSWQSVDSPFAAASVNALHIVCDPLASNDGAILLLVATDLGIFMSRDTGESWHVTGDNFAVLDFCSTSEGAFLAATFLDGIICSTDAGAQWAPTNLGLIAHPPPLLARTESSQYLALDRDSAVAVSTDAGQTWSEPELPLTDDTGPICALATGATTDRVYLAAQRALFRTSPDFAGFQALPSPLPESQQQNNDSIPLLAALTGADANADAIVISAPDGSLFLSRDSAHTWQTVAAPAPGESLASVALTQRADGPVAITAVTSWQDPRGYYQFNVWEWQRTSSGWQALANLASDIPSVLLATIAHDAAPLRLLATQNRLIKLQGDATDGTLVLKQHFFPPDERVTALVPSASYATDKTLFAATDQGLATSRDGSETWQTHAVTTDILPLVTIIPTGPHRLTGVTLGGRLVEVSLSDDD